MILVIEDDASLRANLLDLFESEGLDAVGAQDGTAGLLAARRLRPALILCDLTMPSLDGAAVLAALRADPVLAQVQVVLLTAHAEITTLDEEVRRRADSFVVKPFTRSRILEVVRGVTTRPADDRLVS